MCKYIHLDNREKVLITHCMYDATLLNLVIDAEVKGYHYTPHVFQGSKHKCTVWMGKPLLYQALATSLHNIVL